MSNIKSPKKWRSSFPNQPYLQFGIFFMNSRKVNNQHAVRTHVDAETNVEDERLALEFENEKPMICACHSLKMSNTISGWKLWGSKLVSIFIFLENFWRCIKSLNVPFYKEAKICRLDHFRFNFNYSFYLTG